MLFSAPLSNPAHRVQAASFTRYVAFHLGLPQPSMHLIQNGQQDFCHAHDGGPVLIDATGTHAAKARVHMAQGSRHIIV